MEDGFCWEDYEFVVVIVDVDELQVEEVGDIELEEYVMFDDMVIFMYMLGIMGRLKGVQQIFGNYYFSVVLFVLNLGVMEWDCWFIVLLFFYISGLFVLFKLVIYGMFVVFY